MMKYNLSIALLITVLAAPIVAQSTKKAPATMRKAEPATSY